MCETGHWMSTSSLSSKHLLILFFPMLLYFKAQPSVSWENECLQTYFWMAKPNPQIWHALKRTYTGSGLKTLTGDSFLTPPFAQQINTIILAPSPKINNKKKTDFLFTVWHTALRCSMTSWRLGNEESLHACKQICACYFLQLQDQIFGARCSQFPCGSLGGVVFHASFFAVR